MPSSPLVSVHSGSPSFQRMAGNVFGPLACRPRHGTSRYAQKSRKASACRRFHIPWESAEMALSPVINTRLPNRVQVGNAPEARASTWQASIQSGLRQFKGTAVIGQAREVDTGRLPHRAAVVDDDGADSVRDSHRCRRSAHALPRLRAAIRSRSEAVDVQTEKEEVCPASYVGIEELRNRRAAR